MKYGPQTEHVETLIERASTLTDTDAERLDAVWDAAAQDISRIASQVASQVAAWNASLNVAWNASLNVAWNVARDAAWDAACALIVRDLIGQRGFEQEHYDMLTAPWRLIVGKLHPDDVPLRERLDAAGIDIADPALWRMVEGIGPVQAVDAYVRIVEAHHRRREVDDTTP